MTGDAHHDLAQKAQIIFDLTALGVEDIVPENVVDLAVTYLDGAAGFFSERLNEGSITEAAVDDTEKLISAARFISAALSENPLQPVESPDGEKPAHVIGAIVLEDIANVVRSLNLNPEWKEYYDDMARKMDEYAASLRSNPENSFRFI